MGVQKDLWPIRSGAVKSAWGGNQTFFRSQEADGSLREFWGSLYLVWGFVLAWERRESQSTSQIKQEKRRQEVRAPLGKAMRGSLPGR